MYQHSTNFICFIYVLRCFPTFWVAVPAKKNTARPPENLMITLFQHEKLGGGFNYLLFLSQPGEIILFDEHIVQMF